MLKHHESCVATQNSAHRISLSCCFCAGVRLVGNLTLYLTTKSPREPGFFEMGIPRFGNLSSLPGCVGVDFPTEIFLPSMVVTVRFQPHNASLRSSSTVWMRSSPSRTYRG